MPPIAVLLLLPLLVSQPHGTARAEITPEARAIVDRYVEATGGRTALDTVRTTRTIARIQALAMEGTTATYSRRPNQRASQTKLGPFEIPDGFDGVTGWRTDVSGKVDTLDGTDLVEARASAWFENELWLDPDQGGGSVRVIGTEKDSAVTYTIVEVTPPAGRPRSFWFNPKTRLIDRESTKRDQNVIRSWLSDYRRAGGRLLPFHTRVSIEGMSANDLEIQVDSVFVNEPIDPARFRPPSPESERLTWLKTPGRARLPFTYSGRHVWLRASVNGAPPADFLFDTGASITVLDSAYAAGLGLSMHGELQSQGAGATGSARFSQIRSLRVVGEDGDGLEFDHPRVGVLSINPFLAPFFWRDCAGVIGADFISRVVTTLDFDHAVLTFEDPQSFHYAGAGTAVPFTLAGTMPAIEMTLDDRYSGRFRVDVGSGSTVDLHAPFVDKHGFRERPGPALDVLGGGFGGTFQSRLVRFQKIQVGPYAWTQPLVTLSSAQSGALASEDYAGNVGNQILERFTCTFDYERRILYLEPGAKYPARDAFSRSGVQLVRDNDVVRAAQVLPGSPGARAGIAEGDRVASINGKPIGELSADQVRELIETGEAGRKVKVRIERNGKKRNVTVTLGDIL
jgi:hypothetical protein